MLTQQHIDYILQSYTGNCVWRRENRNPEIDLNNTCLQAPHGSCGTHYKFRGSHSIKTAVRCSAHPDNGNILLVVSGNSILTKCRDASCKRWTKITFEIPGFKINLSEAGITQEVLPENYHIDMKNASTVVA